MKLTNKHILLVTPGFPINEEDTTCIPALQNFVKSLIKNPDIKVTVLTIHYPNIEKKYTWNNTTIYSVGAYNNKFPFRFFSWLKAIKKVKQINREYKIDLIHSFWLTDAALIGKITAKKIRKPHFTTLMGQDVFKSNKYVKWINPNENNLIGLSQNQALIFKNQFNKNLNNIIPWGIEISDSLPVNKTIDILCVGSLTELKNYIEIIDVVLALTKYKKDISIKIIGDGPQKAELTELIKINNLTNNIEVLGSISNADVIGFMHQSKVLFHPSKYESFGYVFLEALSCNMKIVSYNVGFAKASSNWKIVKDKNDFAPEIIKCLDTTFEYNNLSEYDIKKTVESYLKIWNLD